MKRLLLGHNELSGEIPASLGNLTNLRYLELYSDGLSGEIPTELGNLANLQKLHLGSNELSGTIPVELGDLTNLRYLELGHNELSGSIPPELGDLTSLQRILHSNQLTGEIPVEPRTSGLYLSGRAARFGTSLASRGSRHQPVEWDDPGRTGELGQP